MTRAAAVLAGTMVLAACNRPNAPVASDEARAEAAAERKAVADTDASRRDAAALPAEQKPTTPG